MCEGCDAYLHSCLNCKYYEPGRPNDCYIPNTEKVADKATCNFCDSFEFRQGERAPGQGGDAGEARDQFEGLFGGGASDKRERSFDDLFNA
jgi:hypothetical protein